MNYDIHIENLGAIKEADITITPMTILAGENGTGKSFVTKFLYSVLNALSINVYSMYAGSKAVKIYNTLTRFLNEENLVKEQEPFIEEFKEDIGNIISASGELGFGITIHASKEFIDKIANNLELYRLNILPALVNQGGAQKTQNLIFDFYHDYKSIVEDTDSLISYLKSPKDSYTDFLREEIKNQLKENFQIAELNSLIRFNSETCLFSIKNTISIKILKENFLQIELVNFPSFSNLIFIESPVYWRLLPIIPKERFGLDYKIYRGISKETLTGVPKHFLDLKQVLFTNFKDGERPKFIIDCADKLEAQLKGKFNASNGDLTFENNQGQSISKNLVSFGMTNIGIIQAVLSKNIINKGSFVFIDEPESNLHPEWQAILANVLVHLAKNGVYVIVTTHSSDMLKAFDISTQEQEVNEELSTYYFKSDGTLLDMVDDNFTPVEMARRKLLETYEELMMRGYLL